MIHLTARLDAEGRIAEAMFEGHSCAISTAAASLFTEAVVGKTPAEVAAMGLPDIEALMGGTRLSMGRVKCALLPVDAMQRGLKAIGKL
jgi:nitrogen fixation NifU-like protein